MFSSLRFYIFIYKISLKHFSNANKKLIKFIKTNFNFSGYTDSTLPVIIVYCILFVVTAAGNLSVVITLFRSRRHRKSRVSLMICHLAVADLMVAFIMIPLEVS